MSFIAHIYGYFINDLYNNTQFDSLNEKYKGSDIVIYNEIWSYTMRNANIEKLSFKFSRKVVGDIMPYENSNNDHKCIL